MKELSIAIVTCGFIAGSLHTTGLPEIYMCFLQFLQLVQIT
jgi:hypothetical protein